KANMSSKMTSQIHVFLLENNCGTIFLPPSLSFLVFYFIILSAAIQLFRFETTCILLLLACVSHKQPHQTSGREGKNAQQSICLYFPIQQNSPSLFSNLEPPAILFRENTIRALKTYVELPVHNVF